MRLRLNGLTFLTCTSQILYMHQKEALGEDVPIVPLIRMPKFGRTGILSRDERSWRPTCVMSVPQIDEIECQNTQSTHVSSAPNQLQWGAARSSEVLGPVMVRLPRSLNRPRQGLPVVAVLAILEAILELGTCGLWMNDLRVGADDFIFSLQRKLHCISDVGLTRDKHSVAQTHPVQCLVSACLRRSLNGIASPLSLRSRRMTLLHLHMR